MPKREGTCGLEQVPRLTLLRSLPSGRLFIGEIRAPTRPTRPKRPIRASRTRRVGWACASPRSLGSRPSLDLGLQPCELTWSPTGAVEAWNGLLAPWRWDPRSENLSQPRFRGPDQRPRRQETLRCEGKAGTRWRPQPASFEPVRAGVLEGVAPLTYVSLPATGPALVAVVLSTERERQGTLLAAHSCSGAW